MSFRVSPAIEKWRIVKGAWASRPGSPFGFFLVDIDGHKLKIMACAGSYESTDHDRTQGWDHVSVSSAARCPTWKEMCVVKNWFWEEEDTVVQFHPKKSEYVDNHPNCLHLWKQAGYDYELPPSILVGIKGVTADEVQRQQPTR